MSTGDSNPPTRRNERPDSRNPPSPNDPAQPDNPRDAESGQPVDFGSYVSSTVRSAAELFGTPTRSGRSGRRAAKSAERATGSSPSAGSPLPPREAEEEPDVRPRTYWRDSVASDRDDGPRVTYDDDGDDGGRTDGMFPWRFPDDDRTRMLILAGAAILLVAIVALIWLLNRDGDGGGSTDPTATMESVIDAAPTATESGSETENDAAAPSTPTGFEPASDEAPDPTPTDEVRRGGDNQLNVDDPGTPDASRTDEPLARAKSSFG